MYHRYGTATDEVRLCRNCSSRQQGLACRSLQTSSQDLQRRTSHEYPRRIFIQSPTQRIFKILMQGPSQTDFNRISQRSFHKELYQIMSGHLEDFSRTSLRDSHKELYKIMQRPLAAFHQDLHTSFSQRLVKDSNSDLHVRTPKSSQDRQKRICGRRSGSCKILKQERPKSRP